jgi:hypothetical protein
MPDTKPEVAEEAPVVAPVEHVGKPKSVQTSVWAPAGGVAKASVLQAAIQSVRDAIPVVYDLDAEITGAKKSKQDGADGTSFEVTITYTEREMAGSKKDPVDLDKVVKSLEVPTTIHPGDPNFLDQ